MCAFENFKASRFCTLCGERIVVPEDGDYGGGAKQEEAGVELHQYNDSSEVVGSSAEMKTNLTQRQIRAR